jgi:hypothetical protein
LSLLDFFRARRNFESSALSRFLQGQAAYVAQKTVLEYCRVKAGRSERQLFADPDFQAALAHCRWQVFFASLTDVTALIEAHLRPHAAGQENVLLQQLVALHDEALSYEAPPPDQASSAVAARDGLPHHLAGLQLASPLAADRLPLLAEAVLFATLPIHPDQRRGESIAIRGALRFQIVTTQQELERRFDAAQATRNLLIRK